MKRYISLSCVVIVAFMALAVPVSADEVDFSSDYMLELLDYGTFDNDNNLIFLGSGSCRFSPGFSFVCNRVDILFSCLGPAPESISVGRGTYSSLTIVSLGNNLYRAFGSMGRLSTSYLDLNFDFVSSSSNSYIGFKSFKVYFGGWDSFEESAFCFIRSRDFQDTISYIPTDPVNRRVFTTEQSDPTLQWFSLDIWSDNWHKYDYLEYILEVSCSEISSITAYLGNDPLPLQVSWIQSAIPSNGTPYIFSVSVDLTGVDRTSSAKPTVFVWGRLSVATGTVNHVDFLGCVGSVNVETVAPVVYFLRNIWNTLNSNFTSMVNSLSGWFTSVIDILKEGFSVSDTDGSGADFSTEASDQGDQFEDITDAMQGLEKPEVSDSDIDPGVIVPTSDVKFATSPLTVVLSDGVIKDIFMLAMIFIFAGYIIYGKR